MLICVQARFIQTINNKDRPWTPTVRRVAEPVMLRTTILLNNAGATTSARTGGVWVFRTVCFERVVLSSPGRVWPGRMDDHEEVLEAHA